MAEQKIDHATKLAQQGFFEFYHDRFQRSEEAILIDANNVGTARIYLEDKGLFHDNNWLFEITGKTGGRIQTKLFSTISNGRLHASSYNWGGLLPSFQKKLAETLVIHRTWMRDEGMVKPQGGHEGKSRDTQELAKLG